MKLERNIAIFFACISCHLLSVSATTSPNDYKQMYELEQMKRHVEIRRELEKEATPFIVEVNKGFDATRLVGICPNFKESKLSGIPTTWSDFLSAFSFVDFVMGTFSLVALGLGSFYVVWRLNPFASKVEK